VRSRPIRGLLLVAGLPLLALAADHPLVPELPPVAQLTPGNAVPVAAEVLEGSAGDPEPGIITSGTLDQRFGAFLSKGSHRLTAPLWFRLPAPTAAEEGTNPVLLARAGMDQSVEV
jgi:hypothetical protein